MRVLLLSHIDRLAIELEDSRETRRCVVLLFRLLELSEDVLEFVKDGENGLFSYLLSINFSLKHACSQVWNHEELLNQAVHVACASEVL